MKLGNLELPTNIFYSPLAGCSDFPFRKIASLYHKGLKFPEMVKMEALVRGDKGTFRILDYDPSMRPIGGQIVGSNVKIAGQSAKIIEDLGFDSVDFNCGCPVDKVTKDGSGSGMLKTPERIGDIIAEMVSAVKIPVTVKVRAGWSEEEIIAPRIVKIAEEAGAKAIFVHGRTRSQAYRGKANREYIKRCVEMATTIQVIGNGDIFTPEDAKSMFEETGCHGILVSRGTLGKPWISRSIASFLEGEGEKERSDKERIQDLEDHFRFITAYHSDKAALITIRKAGCWYLKSQAQMREFRGKMSRAASLKEVEALIADLKKNGQIGNC